MLEYCNDIAKRLQGDDFLSFIHDQMIGHDEVLTSPFGTQPLVYADYTASGRCLKFVEDHLQGISRVYANSHTEDDFTGRQMTELLHEAESVIKNCVNASANDYIIACGTGATGAIEKLQQVLGIALTPATRDTIFRLLHDQCGEKSYDEIVEHISRSQPVVFVGPFEHHSNEISWREGLCTVVPIRLATDGGVDLEHLEQELQRSEFQGRRLIGAFSAASNVTGMRSDVHKIATILHRFGAIACFDYAAAAPYVEIDMNPPEGAYDGDASLDAVVLSPHKFLGGPGSSGVLLIKDHIYRSDLPPTVSAGGTVSYVGPTHQDYYEDVEEREKPGTPGILQFAKAALAFDLKHRISIERIEASESEYLMRALDRWQPDPAIEILGNPDPARRIGIVSLNISDPRGGVIHPKLVTKLLNDLFGIQSRAGCSCAGPYGHRLLDIDETASQLYRDQINVGHEGFKPGWCRINFHYAMSTEEVDYIIEAISFIAKAGYRFVHLYNFCTRTGKWTALPSAEHIAALKFQPSILNKVLGALSNGTRNRQAMLDTCLKNAISLSDKLEDEAPKASDRFEGDMEDVRFFSFFHQDPGRFAQVR